MSKRKKAAAAAMGVLAAASLATGAVIDDVTVLAEQEPIISLVEDEIEETDSKPVQMKKRGGGFCGSIPEETGTLHFLHRGNCL